MYNTYTVFSYETPDFERGSEHFRESLDNFFCFCLFVSHYDFCI